MTDHELSRTIQLTANACIAIIREARARENNSPLTAEEAINDIKQRFIKQ